MTRKTTTGNGTSSRPYKHGRARQGQDRHHETITALFWLARKSPPGKLTKTDPVGATAPEPVHRNARSNGAPASAASLGNKKNVVVINDEAHHCYRGKPADDDVAALKGEDRKEAEKAERRGPASGSAASKRWKAKIGVKAVYDLSATPFFPARVRLLGRDSLPVGSSPTFSLIDAIESGIVKIPRVPVADDSMQGEQPTYRDLWLRIREHLPKKGSQDRETLG